MHRREGNTWEKVIKRYPRMQRTSDIAIAYTDKRAKVQSDKYVPVSRCPEEFIHIALSYGCVWL
jgi:hypothetical protein